MEKPQPNFSIEELLKEIGMQNVSEDGITTAEIRQQTGKGQHAIRVKLKALFEAGKIECIRKNIVSIDGRVQAVPAYRLKTDKRVAM